MTQEESSILPQIPRVMYDLHVPKRILYHYLHFQEILVRGGDLISESYTQNSLPRVAISRKSIWKCHFENEAPWYFYAYFTKIRGIPLLAHQENFLSYPISSEILEHTFKNHL